MIPYCIFSQEDSTSVKDTLKSNFEFYSEVTLASSNYSRGINFGYGPSIQPFAGISYKSFALEFFGTITANGPYNLGNGHDISISYSKGGFTFGIHDYYFFKYNDTAETGNYFHNNYGDPMRLGHFFEAQAKYKNDKFEALIGYNFYNASLAARIDTKENLISLYGEDAKSEFSGVYIEAKYKVSEYFSFILAGLTGPSELNFYLEDKDFNQYKGGITTVGLNWERSLEIKDLPVKLDIKFHWNPSYRYILNTPTLTVQRSPVILFASITF
jgi:hypothetical protein